MTTEAWIVAAAVVVIPMTWFVLTYNRFVSLRQYIESAWAGIDVELKRRHDLIPQLVQVVRGYAAYESETFKSIAAARGGVVSSPAEATATEKGVARELKQIFAVAEAYPDLKADRRYAELQTELAETEDRIAAARRLYNGNVRDFRSLRDGFPSLIVAGMFGFKAQNPEFFELSSDAERAVPRVAA